MEEMNEQQQDQKTINENWRKSTQIKRYIDYKENK